MRDEWLPSEDRIFGWIERVFAQGVRRPGYAADRWAEEWIARELAALGLEHVRREPVELSYWEPRRALVSAGGREIEGFALPHSTPEARVEAPLVAFDDAAPERVRGAVAMRDVPLMRIPHPAMAGLATWAHDPADTFAGCEFTPVDHGQVAASRLFCAYWLRADTVS